MHDHFIDDVFRPLIQRRTPPSFTTDDCLFYETEGFCFRIDEFYVLIEIVFSVWATLVLLNFLMWIFAGLRFRFLLHFLYLVQHTCSGLRHSIRLCEGINRLQSVLSFCTFISLFPLEEEVTSYLNYFMFLFLLLVRSATCVLVVLALGLLRNLGDSLLRLNVECLAWVEEAPAEYWELNSIYFFAFDVSH